MKKIHFDRNFWVKFFSTGFFISFLVPLVPGVYGVFLGISVALILNSLPIIV